MSEVLDDTMVDDVLAGRRGGSDADRLAELVSEVRAYAVGTSPGADISRGLGIGLAASILCGAETVQANGPDGRS